MYSIRSVFFQPLMGSPSDVSYDVISRRSSTASSTKSFSNHPRQGTPGISETKTHIPLVKKKHGFSGIVYKQLDPTGNFSITFYPHFSSRRKLRRPPTDWHKELQAHIALQDLLLRLLPGKDFHHHVGCPVVSGRVRKKGWEGTCQQKCISV